MNASVNILDNNLSSFKEAEIIAPLFVSETPKGNGLVKMASELLGSAPNFEPGSLFDLVDIDSSKVNVNLNLNQSLPLKLLSSQSKINNNDSKRLVTTIGDIGSNNKAGDLLCLVSGLLLAVPSVVPAKISSLLSSCCGDEFLPGLSGKDSLVKENMKTCQEEFQNHKEIIYNLQFE
ncbi:hypothetical protein DSO57_1030230 [Entomophthora muscae]|uniref:Uncharacterized protein n=1 Tax=Entomophthora muscae TaxID=34485 RepID=A0ACC2TZM3_9FUNG|nr:hypothetical protein DSO57_1030230 [Entomophthora muscae]